MISIFKVKCKVKEYQLLKHSWTVMFSSNTLGFVWNVWLYVRVAVYQINHCLYHHQLPIRSFPAKGGQTSSPQALLHLVNTFCLRPFSCVNCVSLFCPLDRKNWIKPPYIYLLIDPPLEEIRTEVWRYIWCKTTERLWQWNL